ncbi:hypothetical protein ACFLWC_07810 [Chloroflexota bacterium]
MSKETFLVLPIVHVGGRYWSRTSDLCDARSAVLLHLNCDCQNPDPACNFARK